MISVIITAHNRKKFLLSALDSVLNQTLPRTLYEIIIVKNFIDPEIDEKILQIKEKYGIKLVNIFCKDDEIGKKLIVGIDKSIGEVICILEDDDMFHPEKLSTIYTVFSNPKIKFYHNMLKVFGEGYKRKGKIDSLFNTNINSPIVVCDEQKINAWKDLLLMGAGFNLSSMAIRRELVIKYKAIIEQINFAVDIALFYMALIENGCIYIDNYVFTLFRLSKPDTYLHYDASVWEYSKSIKYCRDLELLLSFFDGSYFNQAILNDFTFWKAKCLFLSKLMHNRITVNFTIKDYYNSLKYLLISKQKLRTKFRYFFALLLSLMPKFLVALITRYIDVLNF